jgi:sugar phosphate isomerase/epimerase
MNNRREFIKQTGLFALASTVLPSFACSAMKPFVANKNVGLQLYSLRSILPKDVKGVIEKVAQAGYTEVETYGYSAKNGFWGLSPKDFDGLLKNNNIKAVSGHYGLDGFLAGGSADDLKSCIEATKITGGSYVTVPYLGESLRKTADSYKKVAQKLNEAAKLCKANGLNFAYHNHAFEFTKFENTSGYEILLNETDNNLVDFELDLYWAVRSGNDPLSLFKKHPGRFKMWHVKDMDKANKELNAEVGTGSIDFKPIFAQAKLAGVKHYFVEHETNYKPDELGSVKASFEYLKSNLL